MTEESTEIAKMIRNNDIGLNVLGDDLFERSLGVSSDTIGLQKGNQIYLRGSSASLFSDVVHEGTHAKDYLNGIGEDIIASKKGEIRAFSMERDFQIASGMPIEFETLDDIIVHVWKNYN